MGNKTNNVAEFLAIWQGLTQANALSIKKLVIISDSRNTIQALILKEPPKNMELTHIYRKVSLKIKDFEEVKFFHVLRHLNILADHEANLGAQLNKGELSLNGIISHVTIP